MRIVSWNVHRCIGTDRLYRPERIAQGLGEFNADIIALQEIDSSLRVKGEIDQLSYLARALGMYVVMGPTMSRDYGAYGNALLSRSAFLNHELHDLSYRKFEPRGALVARLASPIGPLRIVNVHLGLKSWERKFQIEHILSKLMSSSETGDELSLLVGDLNEWCPWSGNNRRLERAFRTKNDRIATFPAKWPRFALDRLFIAGAMKSCRFDVPRTDLTRIASDHLPLVADIER